MSNIIIVTTIGTSLLSNYQKSLDACDLSRIHSDNDSYAKDYKTKKELIEDCNRESKNRYEYLKPTHQFYKKVSSYISLTSEDQCAEIKSILKIKDKHQGATIYVKLLATPSIESIFCGLIIQEYLKGRGIEILRGDDFEGLEIIDGLVVNDADQFEKVGAFNLIESLSAVIAKRDWLKELERIIKKESPSEFKKRMKKPSVKEMLSNCFDEKDVEEFGQIEFDNKKEKCDFFKTEILEKKFAPYVDSQVIINISGGYKAIVPVVTLLAQLYANVDIMYIYELSDKLITIPKMPVSFNWDIIINYGHYLLGVVDNKVNFGNKQEDLQARLDMYALNLIDSDDRLTILGKLLQTYFRTNTPMDSSILGVYFEYVLFYAVYQKAGLPATNEYHISVLEKGLDIDTKLKNEKNLERKDNKKSNYGDIDLYIQASNAEGQAIVCMVEAKSIGHITNIDSVKELMTKVYKRLKVWEELSDTPKNVEVIYICLAVWYLKKIDSQAAEAILEDYKENCFKNEVKQYTAQKVEFIYTFNELEYESESLSQNGFNQLFNAEDSENSENSKGSKGLDLKFLDNIKK